MNSSYAVILVKIIILYFYNKMFINMDFCGKFKIKFNNIVSTMVTQVIFS